MSNLLDLPPELVDRIIDHLCDDVQTLRACSLVCRMWRCSSQYHLLSCVLLDLTRPRKTLQPFFDLLGAQDSSIRSKMRSLTLSYPYCSTFWREAIPLLPAVEKLSLINWRHIPAELKSFSEAGTFRNLKDLNLALGSINFAGFVEFAGELPVLEVLTLNGFGWRSRTDAERAARAHNATVKLLPKLKRLHLGLRSITAAPVLTILFERRILPRLSSLQVDELMGGDAAGPVRDLFAAQGPCLQSLTISAKSDLPVNSTSPVQLSENRSLKSIHFQNLVDPRHGAGVERESVSANWVMHTIKQLPLCLREISFSFWLIPGDDLGLQEPTKEGINWKLLNAMLMRFPELDRVTFYISALEQHRRWLAHRLKKRLGGIRRTLRFEGLQP